MIGAVPSVSHPFPGLRPFEPEETHLFFGREGQVDDMLTRLARSRFLAMVGASGCGKSSLVRAGLLPALAGGLLAEAGTHWRIALFRPGADPTANLARALAGASTGALAVEATLRRGGLGLIQAAREIVAPGENVLILADQFEEIFRLCPSADARDSFVKLLLEAIQCAEAAVYVVLTMRSEYLGRCSELRGLPEALNDNQFLVPRLSREQLRQSVEGPVAVGGARIAPALVQRILNDAGEDQDQLPVLQHALMRTWDNWQASGASGEISIQDYEAIGGMAEVLSRHANLAFSELRDERQRDICRIAFQALSEKPADQPETRRPASVAEIAAVAGASVPEVIEVLDRFRSEGRAFLLPAMPDTLRGDSTIDISHESLIRQWDRLQHWVALEAESRERYLLIAGSARRYERGEEGLLQEPALGLALRWRDDRKPDAAWAARYGPEENFGSTMAFLDRSREATDQALRKEAAQKRLRWFFVVALLALSILSVLSVVAIRARNLAVERGRELERLTQNERVLREEAEKERGRTEEANKLLQVKNRDLDQSRALAQQKTEEARRLGTIASSRQLTAQASLVFDLSPFNSLLLAVEAARRHNTLDNNLMLKQALALVPKWSRRFNGGKKIGRVAISNDGRMAAAECDGWLCVFDVPSKRQMWRLKTPDEIAALAFKDDSLMVAMAQSAAVYDRATGRAISSFRYDRAGAVRSIPDSTAFSADSERLAILESPNVIYLFDLPRGTVMNRIFAKEPVQSIAFNDNGEFLGVVGLKGTASVLHAPSGSVVAENIPAWGVAIALSGSGVVAAVASDHSMRVYQAAGGRWGQDRVMAGTLVPPKEVARFEQDLPPAFVAFDRSGSRLVTVGAFGTSVYRLKDNHQTASQPESMINAQFSADGSEVLAGGTDGPWLFQAQDDRELQVLTGSCGELSPKGRYLLACAADQYSVLDTSSGTPVSKLPGKASFDSGTFSGDERFVAVKTQFPGGKLVVRVFDTAAALLRSEIPAELDWSSPLALSHDGKYAALRQNNGIAVFDAAGAHQVARLMPKKDLAIGMSWAYGVAFSPDSRAIAVVSPGELTIFRGATWRDSAVVSKWDARAFASCEGVAFSNDGHQLAGACGESGISVIDTGSGRQRLHRDFRQAVSVAFSPDGAYLAAASTDELRIWDSGSGEEVFRSTGSRYRSVAFTSDGKYLLATTEGFLERNLWRPPDLIEEACARLTRNLTPAQWKQLLPDEPYRKTCPNLP